MSSSSSNPSNKKQRKTNNKRKAGAAGASVPSILTSPGFTHTTSPKHLHQKIALTDEVYAARDRDESVAGFVYLYQVIGDVLQGRETRLKCKYLEERIKDNDPLATIETYKDSDDLQAEEIQVIDEETYVTARNRYKDHWNRIHALRLARRTEEQENMGSVEEENEVVELSLEEQEQIWCADLMAFVAEHGVSGTDVENRRLIDLQFEVIGEGTKPNKNGVEVSFTKRRNVADHSQIFTAYDTGGMWRRIREIAKRKTLRPDKNIVRARQV